MDNENNPSNRQVIYLFLGFVILFIFTFSLGVIVGKGLGGPETRIISEEVPPKTSGKDVKNTEEATQTPPPEELLVEKPPTPGERVEMIKVEKEKTTVPLPTEPADEPRETKKEVATKKELLSEQPLTTVEPIEKKPQLETKQTEAKKTPTPPLIEEQTKLESQKELSTKKDIAAIPATQPGGKYTIQIGAFQKEEDAKQIVNKLKSKGYPAFIKTADIPGKGTWYRVRVGTFSTRVTAKLYAANLKNAEPSVKFVFITVND
jgi:cell division septation protein DedD